MHRLVLCLKAFPLERFLSCVDALVDGEAATLAGGLATRTSLGLLSGVDPLVDHRLEL